MALWYPKDISSDIYRERFLDFDTEEDTSSHDKKNHKEMMSLTEATSGVSVTIT